MNKTRQELYDRIRESSQDEVIIEEMKKLGFWANDKGLPTIAETLLSNESKLTKELRELLKKEHRYTNKEEMLAHIRKERMQASRERQKENKERRKKEKEEKAKKWAALQKREITYLGEHVSNDLNDNVNNNTLLAKYNLPNFENEYAFAEKLGITLGKLRFLAYNKELSTVSHYKKFYMKKKSGGKRLISAPMPELKAVQSWLLHNVLYCVETKDEAHGFIPNKSILTNAKNHVNKEILINIDLKDFFPTVTYIRVRGLFNKLGYSKRLSSILGLLCTEPETKEIALDGKTYHLATGERQLPQGAPTSPMLTNILCRKMDARLNGLSKKYGFVYSRYADDMSFSCDSDNEANITKLLGNVRKVIKDEGFKIHPDKLQIMRKANRKEVTGIVVNEKPNINKRELKKFRALLYQIEQTGLEGKHWNGSTNILASIQGYASYIFMVNPEKGRSILDRVKAILKTNEFKHVIKHHPKVNETDLSQAKKKKPWWKFW